MRLLARENVQRELVYGEAIYWGSRCGRKLELGLEGQGGPQDDVR